MIADIAVVAKQKSALVGRLAIAFAHRAIKTTPAFFQYDFGNFCYARTIRMIALTTLAACDYAAFFGITKATTTQAHVLLG